ncbi:MAG: arsenate reductase family protein [Planctomycetota bacterium]
MDDIFIHLGNCSTCKRIWKDLGEPNIQPQELKAQPLTEKQTDALAKLAGGYEALFSKRSQQIKKLGLDIASFTAKDYRKYLLEHYSFLKRPVLVVNDQIFVGNSKSVIEAMKAAIE